MTATQTLAGSDPVLRLPHREPVFVLLDTTVRGCARVMADESIGVVFVRGPGGPAGVDRRHLSRDALAVLASVT